MCCPSPSPANGFNPATVDQPLLPPPLREPADPLPAGPLPNGKIGIVRQCVTEFLLKAIPVRIFHSHIVSTRVVGGNRDVASEILDVILVRRLLEAAQSAQDLEIDFRGYVAVPPTTR